MSEINQASRLLSLVKNVDRQAVEKSSSSHIIAVIFEQTRTSRGDLRCVNSVKKSA